MLVILYDEHGGFYDHVTPPPVSDESGYEMLGLRVPALIVGPRVRNFVCHEAFDDEAWDHTALIRSILLAFVRNSQQAIDAMGGRVKERKAHLGLMLEDAPRTDLPDEASRPEARLRRWREEARAARVAADRGRPSVAPDGAGQDFVVTDFQAEWIGFAAAMRHGGLPRGT